MRGPDGLAGPHGAEPARPLPAALRAQPLPRPDAGTHGQPRPAAGPQRRVWPLALAALMWLACALLPARAERHALLVGVSAYPGLPASLQLTSPAHDVRGLRQALRLRGFDAARVQVLADGVEDAQGLPTRDAILAALDDLARRVRRGDTVVVLMSGHGSQEPAGPGASRTEGDGWRETFLPRDVGRWDGRRGQVERALTDRELRAALDRIADEGAFVWGIFDACHSGTLVRGGEGPTAGVRQVAPADLGVPGVPPLGRPGRGPAAAADPAPASQPQPQPRGAGRAVYFYAAQSGESVMTLPLPRQLPDAPQRGLLSWSVATALSTGQPMTYRQLAQHVLAQYGSHHAAATPLFSGDGLDLPVLDQRAPAWRQWPLDARGGGPGPAGRVALAAGSLDGIAEGALFALLPGPLSTTTPPRDGTAGVLRAARVQAATSELEPVAWGGRAATPAAALGPGSWVRLIGTPPAFALRVAVDRAACKAGCVAGAALDQLAEAGVPGVDVRWVPVTQAADVVVQATADGVRYGLGAQPPPPPPAPTPVPAARAPPGATGTVTAAPAAPGPTVLGAPLPADTPPAVAAARIAADLHAVARARNLLELAGQIALRTDTPVVETVLELRSTDRRRNGGAIAPQAVPTVLDGDGLVLRIHNPGVVPVDLTVLLIDGDHGVTVRYPLDRGESNRLEPGGTLTIDDMTVNTRTTGTERLLVVWNEMAQHRERRDFSFLQQSPLARVRGTETRTAIDPALQALLDACFADQLTRGDAPAIPAQSLGMRVYTLQVAP